ncbi:MAG: amidophosphoribosyltransferase, partial [Clostridiales bacterium]|nr:amidophosphoribosyltransferase [Clostridiales bacterium]
MTEIALKRMVRTMEELREKCGVFGLYDKGDNLDISRLVFFALYDLQHRGQESCGIAVAHEQALFCHKDTGLVSEVFNDGVLDRLKGRQAIGHVCYSGAKDGGRENAQPAVAEYRGGKMALAFNGSLVNGGELRRNLCDAGDVFVYGSDTEIMLKLMCRSRAESSSLEQAAEKMMREISGAYAVVLLAEKKLLGFRDPFGIRPLCIGKLKKSYMLSSESCAFASVGAEFVRDVHPGEIVTIDEDGLHSHQTETPGGSALCSFEFVYFARPDSYVDGVSVHNARLEAGRMLAAEHPVEADLVIGVPDSALSAALGYSRGSGIPYGHGLIRNRYVGRTFIQPRQELRDTSVKIKFSALQNDVSGKRLVLLDDSIVRGTTTRIIVQMLKEAGAKEVHMRTCSPPVI